MDRVRVLLPLKGVAVLGVLLAVLFWEFLGSHPAFAVLVAVVYVAVCAVGAYSCAQDVADHR
jgi:hypothetical protein